MPITKLRPSFTLTEDRLAELRAVVPEAFADGAINWDALREALGEHLESDGPKAEHFGLFWPGKREARRLAAMPSKGALIPAPGEGVDEATTRNLFIEGDNLEVLKLLQKSYAGRVKMIYIDPPYNTGNDFVYKDDFTDPLDGYLRKTGQAGDDGELLTSNPKAGGRFHSNWLSMMYPRLLLAKRMLQMDGVLFISIDDNEVHNLRQMIDEVFGPENFITQITVQSNPRGRQSERFVATVHEYVLVIARDVTECRLVGAELSDKQLKDYKYQDDRGEMYRLLGLRQRGSASRRVDRPNMFFPLYVNPANSKVALEQTGQYSERVLPKKSTGEDGRWMWGKEKIARSLDIIEAKLVESRGEWDIFVRDFLRSPNGGERTTKFKTIWNEKEINYQNGTQEIKELLGTGIFDFPKPTSLLRRIISMVEGSVGVYLDFFSGSATMAQALLEQNQSDDGERRFILVQLPEPTDNPKFPTIAEIGKERIRRVIKAMKKGRQPKLLEARETPEDLGFKIFKLGRSNFKGWKDFEGDDMSQLETLFDAYESPLVKGWKAEGLLAETLLIEGFPLDSTVTPQTQFARNRVVCVASDACAHRLFVCFNDAIDDDTVAVLRAGQDLSEDDIFICLDSALSDEAKVRLSDAIKLHVI